MVKLYFHISACYNNPLTEYNMLEQQLMAAYLDHTLNKRLYFFFCIYLTVLVTRVVINDNV